MKKSRPTPQAIVPEVALAIPRETLPLDELETALAASHEAEAQRLEAAARESRTHAIAVIARRRGLVDGRARFRIDWDQDGAPRLVVERAPEPPKES